MPKLRILLDEKGILETACFTHNPNDPLEIIASFELYDQYVDGILSLLKLGKECRMGKESNETSRI